ncbi:MULTISPECIES: hypothetical protein [unclassified Nocardia]|uniref:hypothetical protein n=1 Tax=unclassified Nocardia TaxID=2637762 RepID=UPI001CE4534E|nr:MULTISPECIES: hypothetical protein [unclassified Nocardia]
MTGVRQPSEGHAADPTDGTDEWQAVLARIDGVLDAGEPETGYNFGDPTYPLCPNPYCPEQWHGQPITMHMWQMYLDGVLDPDNCYHDDDSPVLCPGST